MKDISDVWSEPDPRMAEPVPDINEGVSNAHSAGYPQVRITNGHVRANVYLPDARLGFYRGTRFDWSGVISSLQCEGHEYYGPWFTRRDPSVADFIFDGPAIVAGAHSAITGPAEEFVLPQGYEEAKAGETFVKIGVGALLKSDDAPYSCYNDYEIADAGSWAIESSQSSITFTHQLNVNARGYGYVYRKTLSLAADRPELFIEHSLENTGRVALQTAQYNHNFLTLDHEPIGANLIITFPFQVSGDGLDPEFVAAEGKQVSYKKQLVANDVVAFPLSGFGSGANDYDIRIHHRTSRAGLRMIGDRPLIKLAVWSIRSVLSVEPFIEVRVEPSSRMRWTYRYLYGSASGAVFAAN
ncbi:MAG: hypothetical protein M3P99_06305 [Pseudomonadota bacterium]|nr:hypothetical protein [Pseudomonadota bacterium]